MFQCIKVNRRRSSPPLNCRMLKTYSLDVKAGDRSLNRFKVRFVLDEEAIQHSQDLAATIRHRHFNNHPGLLIEVIDPSSRTIHKEIVYPKGEHKT
jgi:hypothetical protein